MTLETEDRLKKEHTAQAAQQYVTLPGINSLPTAERLSTNNSPSESLAAETTPTIAVAAAPDSKPFGAQLDKRSIAVLSAGHIFNDLNQGALPVMLPYLITAHHLTYEQAAGLVLMTNLFSSLLQPGFGTLSDKPSFKINMAPIGLSMAGLGVAAMGAVPSYNSLLLAAAISGTGVAAFHPDAARMANFVSGKNKATGMSFFALGGNIGFAVGPLVATALLLSFGVRGAQLLAVPALTVAFILFRHMRKLTRKMEAEQFGRHSATAGAQRDRWAPFTFLTLTIVCRSIIFFGLNTFLPLYWIHQLHQDKAVSGAALTVLLSASAIGTLLGGKLADRIGEWKVVFSAMVILPFSIAAFLAAGRVEMATLCLIPVGMCLSGTFSVMVVMGQRYLPARIGLAAGVTMGLAGSVGGLVTPWLGKIADRDGIHSALLTLIGFAALALVLTATTAMVERLDARKGA